MSSYSTTRCIRIEAPVTRVHELVDDLREWQQWFPWEDRDPSMSRTYTGPVHGVGATCVWSGNRRAGAGSMQVVRSERGRIGIDVRLTRPVRARIDACFDLVELPDGATRVTWTMTGEQTLLLRVLDPVLKIERAVGEDVERGLARLRQRAES